MVRSVHDITSTATPLFLRCAITLFCLPVICRADSLTVATPTAPTDAPKRVLIVHSFGSSTPPFTTHSTAFETTLTHEMGKNVDLDEVSLDMARYAQPDMEDALADLLRKRLSKWQPDLVVPIGSPAGRFVAKFRDRLFPQTAILYTGMDKRTLPAGTFDKNATFVGEDFDLKGLIEDILQLVPDTNHIVVILGDTPLERYWTAAFREAFAPFADRVKFTWVNDLPFDQVLDRVSKLPPHSFILLGLLIRDASGVTHNEDDALVRLRAVANAPINGLFQNQLGLGIVGGHLYQGELEGIESARIAIRILRGEPISNFPPKIIGTVGPRYDWRQLRRWKISEDRLPPGSTVDFRQATAWERYGKWVVLALTIFVLQSATILALIVQRRRRRRIKMALQRSQQFIELATGAAELGFWSRDLNGTANGNGNGHGSAVWLNGPMRNILGFGPDEPVEFADIFARVHADDQTRMVTEVRRAHSDELPFEGEIRLCLPGGAERWILARGRTITEPAEAHRHMGVVLDITQRKRAESEERRIHSELAHISRVTTLGELAASLAHELTQPLTANLANAQAGLRLMAHESFDSQEIREILSDIVANDKRASQIIYKMRSLARKETPAFASLDMAGVIREIVGLIQGDLICRNLRVSLDIAPDLPAARGDKVQLQQVLLNLFLNAFAAMKDQPEKEREVSVRVDATDEAGMVHTSITDHGPGVAADALDKIFEPFYTTKHDGLGMGLSISQTIIKAHGGRLWAENNPAASHGATFHFTLPIRAEPLEV